MIKIQIRLLQSLYEQIHTDLQRPHAFASERIGFLFTREGKVSKDMRLIFPTDYLSVADDGYLATDDPNIGAIISSQTIRLVMQRALNTGERILHVHKHDHLGLPRFSRIDSQSLPNLVQSFQNANPVGIHGALLLSQNSCAGMVRLPKGTETETKLQISIIGYPMRFFGR